METSEPVQQTNPDQNADDHHHDGPRSRHVSIRVPHDLYERLELSAEDHDETVSRAARRILSEGLAPPERDVIDDAISALLTLRRQLPHRVDAADGVATETRSVNILNAKTDLQRLIDEVGRGVEIIITHAGAQRARLVQVASPHEPTTIPASRIPVGANRTGTNRTGANRNS